MSTHLADRVRSLGPRLLRRHAAHDRWPRLAVLPHLALGGQRQRRLRVGRLAGVQHAHRAVGAARAHHRAAHRAAALPLFGQRTVRSGSQNAPETLSHAAFLLTGGGRARPTRSPSTTTTTCARTFASATPRARTSSSSSRPPCAAAPASLATRAGLPSLSSPARPPTAATSTSSRSWIFTVSARSPTLTF